MANVANRHVDIAADNKGVFSPHLARVFAGPNIKNDPVLQKLILILDRRKDIFFYFGDFQNRIVEYMSESCEQMLGYSAREFMVKGAGFFFEKTEPSQIPGLIKIQNDYVNRIKAPGFDPYAAEIIEFSRITMITITGERFDVLTHCIMLAFSKHAELGFGICVITKVSNTEAMNECDLVLRAIKARHNEIYTHPPFATNNSLPNLVYTTQAPYEKIISKRELEVLKLLARGYSTKELALQLHISENTAEAHRRHLLEKLEAKNSAELIKKASKVFWLE